MLGWAALIWAAGMATLRAHDPGISTAQGRVLADRIELTTGFAPADAVQFVPPEKRTSGKMTPDDFERVRIELEAIAPKLWEARAGERTLPPRDTRVQLLAGDNVSFLVVFPVPSGSEEITLRATQLGELPSGHREFVVISDEQGAPLAKKLLSAKDHTIVVKSTRESAAPASPGQAAPAPAAVSGEAPTFWGFVWLGMEHIWIGYDHLLFLFALLIVCQSFRSIVKIITCFTIAHSLTLALATLDLVNLPGWIVEPAIAASIVFVGLENLVSRGAEPKGRWMLTFAFGLIHGFGFASVLRDLGVGSGTQAIAMPLFTFNLGVEIGQVAIAAVVLPLVWQLRKNEKFVRRGVPFLSAIVAAAGLYWLLERTMFG